MRLIGPWRKRLAPFVDRFFYLIAKKIGDSLRMKTVGWDQFRDTQDSVIFCSWHGRAFMGSVLFRNLGYWVIASNSRDGELLSKVFRRFGFRTIRGSSGREGVRTAIETIRVLRAGAKITITPDGPRGPAQQVQDGVLMMAQKSGAIIVTVGASAQHRWFFNSWDRFMLPKPFSKAVMIFGDPIRVPVSLSPEEMKSIRDQLQSSLDSIQTEADRMMGHA